MTPEQRCKTCKHWQPISHKPDREWSQLEAWPHFENAAECQLAKRVYLPGDTATLQVTLAVSFDAERYHSGLYTSPEFGCVMWEGKECGEAEELYDWTFSCTKCRKDFTVLGWHLRDDVTCPHCQTRYRTDDDFGEWEEGFAAWLGEEITEPKE